ncbi:glycine zipper 2TM domain-containing protein [Asticcacaulis sp. EMRT-3]|uniref:glycine zipper 2TM domain-containing protein n=1 Tax=Asticcacaulis sp. EMRT-3 TaxID=3040349 RepID=UPI0024AFB2C1|nr:glycine zipper 2TM domain-containing protein [Asticcacaulis sp. EMRT-3]MDI7776127.1 glycine zipper 2TM domain-containing protein [Asticcacaulis sp. EMRT-3]
MRIALLLALGLAAVAQPVLAQSAYDNPNDGYPGAQPQFQRYSGAQNTGDAYEQGRADQARADDGAPAQGRHYDGYCYARKDQASATGAIAGAALGGVIANGASGRWDRGSNTVAGALLGAVLGSSVGRSSIDCYDGDYYPYDAGYYAPPPPPVGYSVVYFNSRPSYGYHYVYRSYGRGYGWDHGWGGRGFHHRW